MGTIYQQARLTVAAPDAENSTQRLYFDRPSLPALIKIPFTIHGCKDSRSFFVSLKLSQGMDEEDPNSLDLILDTTILTTRGWTTQEWLLSPRMIHFLKNTIYRAYKNR